MFSQKRLILRIFISISYSSLSTVTCNKLNHQWFVWMSSNLHNVVSKTKYQYSVRIGLYQFCCHHCSHYWQQTLVKSQRLYCLNDWIKHIYLNRQVSTVQKMTVHTECIIEMLSSGSTLKEYSLIQTCFIHEHSLNLVTRLLAILINILWLKSWGS